MNAIIMTILIIVGMSTFAAIVTPRVKLLLRASKGDRFGQWGERFRLMLRYAAFQYKMPRDPVAGIAHIFIYAGFMVLALRTLTLFIRAYAPSFEIPGMLGDLYSLLKDIIWILVLSGVIYGLWRRLGPKETRVGRSWEGVFVLFMILMLGITDIVYDGVGVSLGSHAGLPWNPLGHLFFNLAGSSSKSALESAGVAAYWIHCVLILGFLNFLPLGKHFHVLTSFFNVFFSHLKPRGYLAPTDLEKAEK